MKTLLLSQYFLDFFYVLTDLEVSAEEENKDGRPGRRKRSADDDVENPKKGKKSARVYILFLSMPENIRTVKLVPNIVPNT